MFEKNWCYKKYKKKKKVKIIKILNNQTKSLCRVFGNETIDRKYVVNVSLCGYLNK